MFRPLFEPKENPGLPLDTFPHFLSIANPSKNMFSELKYHEYINAPTEIRTPVTAVKGQHSWPLNYRGFRFTVDSESYSARARLVVFSTTVVSFSLKKKPTELSGQRNKKLTPNSFLKLTASKIKENARYRSLKFPLLQRVLASKLLDTISSPFYKLSLKNFKKLPNILKNSFSRHFL